MGKFASEIVHGQLVDLSISRGSAFADILIDQADVGVAKIGITDQFLEGAETWAARFSNVEYFRTLIVDALEGRLMGPPGTILDIGSGSGNSIFPLLDMFPAARVVATDLSENMLAILRKHIARAPGALDRLAFVCVDATRASYQPESVDLIIGAAVLHHLVDPGLCVTRACAALRPGGLAVFFEPFEAGCAILRIAYERILQENECRPSDRLDRRAVDGLTALVTDFRVRAGFDRSSPLLSQIDDKWLFTRSYFEQLAGGIGGMSVQIEPLFHSEEIFSLQTRTYARLVLGAAAGEETSVLPQWVWDIMRSVDDALSPALKRDLPIEAKVIFRRDC